MKIQIMEVIFIIAKTVTTASMFRIRKITLLCLIRMNVRIVLTILMGFNANFATRIMIPLFAIIPVLLIIAAIAGIAIFVLIV